MLPALDGAALAGRGAWVPPAVELAGGAPAAWPTRNGGIGVLATGRGAFDGTGRGDAEAGRCCCEGCAFG